MKLIGQLFGAARAAPDEVPMNKPLSEEGAEAIVQRLRENFAPHAEAGGGRKGKEPLQDYVIRMGACVLFQHANLTQVWEDQLTTWAGGRYHRDEVVKALTRPEKVATKKDGGRHPAFIGGPKLKLTSGCIRLVFCGCILFQAF